MPGHLVRNLDTMLLRDLVADLLVDRVGHLLGHLGALLSWHLSARLFGDILDHVDTAGGGDAGALWCVDKTVRLDGNLLANTLDLGGAPWSGGGVAVVTSLALAQPVNLSVARRHLCVGTMHWCADLFVDVFTLVYISGLSHLGSFIDTRLDLFGGTLLVSHRAADWSALGLRDSGASFFVLGPVGGLGNGLALVGVGGAALLAIGDVVDSLANWMSPALIGCGSPMLPIAVPWTVLLVMTRLTEDHW